ncbi:MAG: hypothetical protein ACM67T_06095 [Clostridiales bacterium]|nr:hypothetical protein [Oscillospiraceae bacterium]
MNIRRLVAAALALLMLLSFVGCKTVDKTTDKKLPSSSGSSNEAISEEQSENTEQESSATPSDSSDNSASASEGGSTAKETQNQSGGTATTAQLKPDIKKSRNFLGTDLDGWYNWALAGKGYNEGANYIKVWAEEFDSHDNLVKRVSYKTLDGESIPSITTTYEYTYNGNGTVKEIRTNGGNGYIYSYEYDSAKRITKISVVEPISGDTMNSYKFTYNKSGKLIGVDSGKVAGMDGTEYKITVSYDGSGRVSKKEKVYSGGLVKSYKYEYNSRNDISRKTEEVKQSDDYLKNVTDYKYDENGALIKLTVKSSDGSSQESVYTNDKYGNPVSIKVTKTANGKTVSSHSYPYTYKYESNRITVTEHDGSKKIYEYHKNQSIMLDDSRIF